MSLGYIRQYHPSITQQGRQLDGKEGADFLSINVYIRIGTIEIK